MNMSPLGVAHVTASVIALGLGLVVLAARKGTNVHRLIGTGYVAAMILVNVSALGTYRLTGQFGPFHALALVSLAVTASGLLPVLRRRKNWMAWHFHAMAYSYLGLLAAASAETFLRLRLFGALGATPSNAIGIGVAIAILFAVIGALVIPRLAIAALGNAADHGG
jgi:uncharacterized membrane protein